MPVADTLYRKRVFLDTSAIVAIVDSRDQWHQDAVAAFELLRDEGVRLYVCLSTIHETFTRLRKLGFSVDDLLVVLNRTVIPLTTTLVIWDHDCCIRAEEILVEFKWVPLSYHDAFLASNVTKHQASRIFSFDKEFAHIGFELFPGY